MRFNEVASTEYSNISRRVSFPGLVDQRIPITPVLFVVCWIACTCLSRTSICTTS